MEVFIRSRASQPVSVNSTSARRKFVPPASITATGTPLGGASSQLMYAGAMGRPPCPPARPASIPSKNRPAHSPMSIRSGSIPCFFRKSSAVIYVLP